MVKVWIFFVFYIISMVFFFFVRFVLNLFKCLDNGIIMSLSFLISYVGVCLFNNWDFSFGSMVFKVDVIMSLVLVVFVVVLGVKFF